MKRVVFLLVVAVLLGGCSAPADFETMKDVYGEQPLPQLRQVQYTLPPDASAQAMQSTYGQLYFCDGYDITLQTFTAGDLDKTFREVTGFPKAELSVIETGKKGIARYECVWSSVGEEGDMVGRAVILDDGNYHYCIAAMASADKVLQLKSIWQELFDSFIPG